MMKNDFITAYTWLYGASKKGAGQVWKTASEEYKKAIIETFENNAKQNFYND